MGLIGMLSGGGAYRRNPAILPAAAPAPWGNPSAAAPSAARLSRVASAPLGAPVDAEAVRVDFGAAPETSENILRAYAIAARARERLFELVERRGAALADSGPKAAAAQHPETPAPASYAAPLQALRGQPAGGGELLDSAV